MTVTEDFAAWAGELAPGDVPADVSQAARRHLLDGVANAVGSRLHGAVDPALAVAEALGGPEEAAVLGAERKLSAPAAALADGALVHGLDFDDTHAGGLVHATAVALPAAFTVGQQVGASGAEVLTAVVIGYELVCRVSAAVPHGFHARGVHATHAVGTLAAAAIAARLMELDAATTVSALGIAGSASSGLLEFLDTGSSTKQLHPGTASMAGVLAARLAAAGATGPSSVLEGRQGVWAALSEGSPDIASVTKGLGAHWETTRITIKPYPACQLMHVSLDAVAAATEGQRIDPAGIVTVTASVHPDSAAIVSEPAADKVTPRTTYDAKFSLPWSVAALLIDGAVGVSTYSPNSVGRPEVADLAARVHSHIRDPGVVAADAPGHVEITLADGRVLLGDVAHSRGGPAAPLPEEVLRSKVVDLCGGPGPAVDALIHAVNVLPGALNLTDVHGCAARVVTERRPQSIDRRDR